MSDCCQGGMANEACAAACCALSELRVGEGGAVTAEAVAEADLAALRALGLGPKVSVVVRRRGSPCIVEVRRANGPACRIGLTKALARRVMVEPTVSASSLA
ncbi:MAG: ferrous iron transport protein A [Planctomycetota bacterium]